MQRIHIATPMVVIAVSVLLTACGRGPAATGDEGRGPLENGSFTAELNGHRIHYEVHGSGPVLMTVPNSWGLSLEGLRGMYEPLEAYLTMVYFDPRGMGGSGPVTEPHDMSMEAVRSDFQALREHLGLEKVHAIGWSNGASNLILLASERPETLESAIFVHGAAKFDEEDWAEMSARYPALIKDWEKFEASLAADELSEEERTARTKAFWLERYFPEAMARPEVSIPAMRAAFDPAEFSRAHVDFTNAEYPTFDTTDLLPDIPVRSLVIAGEADIMPPEKVRALADGLPDAEFVVLRSSGHFGPIEEPDRFREVVLRFLGVGWSSPADD